MIAATCARTSLPLTSTGGANGGCTAPGASSSACTASSPPSASSMPTSTYATPASSSARRTNSPRRSEEHTSELQSLMRISYAVFCLKKTKRKHKVNTYTQVNVTLY